MNKIKEKNTDRHFSDFLPPALVKDWRQFLRSRGYIAFFLLLQLWAWYFYIQAATDDSPSVSDIEDLRLQLFYFGVLVLGVIVPFRAGSSVSSDTKVRGTNFLMLTPLSARRIVWGTWCSSALQVLLAAVLALPLVYACRHLEADYSGAAFDTTGFVRDLSVLGLMTLCGWVTSSLFMFTAGLARFFRIALVLGVGVTVTTVFSTLSLVMTLSEQEQLLDLLAHDPLVLPLLLVGGASVFMLMLELTRRHYAAPAENCSASVRLLALLPLLVYLGMAVYEYHFSEADTPVTGLVEQGYFACYYLLFALISDALLPTYAMPVHSRRAWRVLPACLQVPGIVPSTLCIVLGTALAALPAFISGGDAELSCLWTQEDRMEFITVHGLGFLNLAYTLLLWLLVTDIICRRDNRNRPVIYGFVALITMSIAGAVKSSLVGDMLRPTAGLGRYIDRLEFYWSYERLPLADIPELTDAYIAGGIALAVVVLLLIAWRGRVHKG